MYCKNCGTQIHESAKFCKNCGFSHARPYFHMVKILGEWKKAHPELFRTVVLALFLLFLLAVLKNPFSLSNDIKHVEMETAASYVVNIVCRTSEGDGSGGSGTIMTSEGYILTNNHVIPQDKRGNSIADICLVTLPDSQGKIRAIYQGSPLQIPKLSKENDLAFIKIDGSYTDTEGTTWGEYPTPFPNLVDSGCVNKSPVLGEPVRILGYPSISGGGYYLTITDGVVSSLPEDGTIVTSAKIAHGNSGGLAVDQNGCMLGVPVAVSQDSAESLGVLISNETIHQFVASIPENEEDRFITACQKGEVKSEENGGCVSRDQYCKETAGINSSWNGDQCTCNAGNVWNSSKTACISRTASCTAAYPNAVWDGSKCTCMGNYLWNPAETACITQESYCSQKYKNSQYERTTNTCGCMTGYEWNEQRTACLTRTENFTQSCQKSFGSSSYYTGKLNSQGGPVCDCRNGSSWNTSGTMCISDTDYDMVCKTKYGSNTYYTGEKNTTGEVLCDCRSGYYWNDARTACYSSAQYDQGCKSNYGSGSYYSTYSDSCGCSYGYTYSNVSNYCIANQ